jgi:hypothetical protein
MLRPFQRRGLGAGQKILGLLQNEIGCRIALM